MNDIKNGIVINTSPWIALSICAKTELLKQLYEEVYMPIGVKEEILIGGEEKVGVTELGKSSWLKVEEVTDIEKPKLLYELDRGEAEVIILAKEKKIKEVLIDEKVARMQAKILGLEAIGTLGLLLMAKKKGFLSEIKPLIETMLQRGIWISSETVKGILEEAGED